jgi:hypothetical protein
MPKIIVDKQNFFSLVLILINEVLEGEIEATDDFYEALEKIIRSKSLLRQYKFENKHLFQKLKILLSGIEKKAAMTSIFIVPDTKRVEPVTGKLTKIVKKLLLRKDMTLQDKKNLEELLEADIKFEYKNTAEKYLG